MEKLKEILAKLDKPRILDVGTGGGNFIKLLSSVYDNYESIVGIDQLEIAISSSSKNFEDKRISFLQMDAFNMSFEDNKFDVVCLSNSLHHLRDVAGILKEMERVLKPGGTLLINEMMQDHLTTRQITHLKLHHFAAEIDRERGQTHNETFKRTEIIEVLEANSSLTVQEAWDMEFEREPENSEEEIQWLLKTIDRLSDRVEDKERQKHFKEKGERIKEYVLKVGFDSATQLLVILQ